MIRPRRSLSLIQADLRSGKYSMVELTRTYLQNISETVELNIYVEVYEDDILAYAERLDAYIATGAQLKPLHGCILSIKDVIAHAGHGLTAGSRILEGYISPFDATAVQRLVDAGAAIIGRTNCDEFGMGSANENSIYGPTKNGIGDNRVPGGSSGGAAVAVQQDTCLVALGSDTGGSVRQPAAFCGVLGLKPSYGMISRYGLVAYASSFDQIGVLGHDADDLGLILQHCAGSDAMDPTSTSSSFEPYDSSYTPKSMRIAYFSDFLDHASLSEEIKVNIFEKIEHLRSSHAIVDQISFSLADQLVPTYYVLTTAEASTNLSRYDGVRYGYRSVDSSTLEDLYVNTRTEGFGEEVKRRILLGTYVLSEGYYDAYFAKAQKVRRMIIDEVCKVLDFYDMIIMPCSTTLPWKIGEMHGDTVAVYLSDMYTVLANLTGMPAISVPSGHNEDGLPFGIQMMAGVGRENDLLSVAKLLMAEHSQ